MFRDFKYISIPALPEYKEKLEDEDLGLALEVLEWVRQLNSDIKWESNPKAITQTAVLLFNIPEV
jgi:hypothetical protein